MCPEATVPHVKADFSVYQRSSAAHQAMKQFTILRANTLSKWGLLKKPDRLQRSWFQRLRADKLRSIKAIHDCYNC
jgi:hypothetical protein